MGHSVLQDLFVKNLVAAKRCETGAHNYYIAVNPGIRHKSFSKFGINL
jgi:hypothetical protein